MFFGCSTQTLLLFRAHTVQVRIPSSSLRILQRHPRCVTPIQRSKSQEGRTASILSKETSSHKHSSTKHTCAQHHGAGFASHSPTACAAGSPTTQTCLPVRIVKTEGAKDLFQITIKAGSLDRLSCLGCILPMTRFIHLPSCSTLHPQFWG